MTARTGQTVLERAAPLLLLLAWNLLCRWWIGADGGPLDGDAMGHVGAVEDALMRLREEGPSAVLRILREGPRGEYPPLHSLVLALWLAVGGAAIDAEFDDAVARANVDVLTLVTGALVGRMGGVGALGTTVAAAWIVGSPLWAALCRAAMPEPFVATLVVGAWWVALRGGSSVKAGLIGAAAAWSKQTAGVLWLGLATLALLEPGRRRLSIETMLWAGLLSFPLYAPVLTEQWRYLLASASENPDAVSGLRAWAQYPLAITQQFWTLATCLSLGAALLVGGRPRGSAGALLGVAGVAALVVSVLPKRYDRLVLFLIPAVAMALGAWLGGPQERPSKDAPPPRPSDAEFGMGWRGPTWLGAALVAVPILAQLASSAAWGLPGLAATRFGITAVDERCPQRWVEGPRQRWFPWDAFDAALDAADPHRIATVGAPRWPDLSCELETTPALDEHLRIHLRRAGTERTVLDAGNTTAALWLSTTVDPCAETPELCAVRGAPTQGWAFESAAGSLWLWSW